MGFPAPGAPPGFRHPHPRPGRWREINGKEPTIPRAKKTVPAAAELLKLVEASLDDDKAQGVIVIDLEGKSDIADFMVIASGASRRQVDAMSGHIREKIKKSGAKRVSIEGRPRCDWVLIDAGDVVVHLFRPEIREFYNLEKMWSVPAKDPEVGLSA